MRYSSHQILVGLAILSTMLRTSISSIGSRRCPCAVNPSQWQVTLEQAVRISDVVLLGKVVNIKEGLRGTMNATVASIYSYKGTASFLTQVSGITNFDRAASQPKMTSLFFLVKEPAGNLALQCMSPLPFLDAEGGNTLMSVLSFVNSMGEKGNNESKHFRPPTPNPCLSSPTPCPSLGAYCSVRNTLPGNMYKCVCLTGYVGDGRTCKDIDEPSPSPTPPDIPACGGLSPPLLDSQGELERCTEGGEEGTLDCPHMYYCHHGHCCPVTLPTPKSINIVIAPSPSSSSSPSTSSTSSPPHTDTSTPSPHPTALPISGSGGGSGDCVGGVCGSGDLVGSGGCEGSGCGSGGCEGSGCRSGDVVGSGGCKGSGCGSGKGESEDASLIQTFFDDEDMAYGGQKRRR